MSDAIILCERLVREFDDKPLALVAADAVQEEHNSTRLDALKAVATIRRTARNRSEVATAHRLIAHHSPRRRILSGACLSTLGFPPGNQCTILIVSGSRPPALAISLDRFETDIEPGPYITVGARWILRVNQNHALWSNSPRPKKRAQHRAR